MQAVKPTPKAIATARTIPYVQEQLQRPGIIGMLVWLLAAEMIQEDWDIKAGIRKNNQGDRPISDAR